MKHFTLIVLVCFTTLTKAQTFFSKHQVYQGRHVQWGSGGARYIPYRDTLKFDSLSGGWEYYSIGKNSVFRTQGNKLYSLNENSTWDLYYDFNAKAGDTLPIFKTGFGDSLSIVIDSIKSISIYGKTRKVQHVHQVRGCSDGMKYTFVEHIGSIDAGVHFWTKFCFELGNELFSLCDSSGAIGFKQNQDSFVIENINCDSSWRELGFSEIKKKDLLAYPNPAYDCIHIEIPQAGELVLYNIEGKELNKIWVNPGVFQQSVTDLKPGIYYGIIHSKIATFKTRFVVLD